MLALIDADDGVQRGVDNGLQPSLASVQLLVAFLQRLALGEQRALVDHGAQVLPGGRPVLLVHGHAGNMQVTAQLVLLVDLKQHLMHLSAARGLGLLKRHGHALGVALMHKGLEVDQQPVFFGGLKGTVRHGIGLHHHVELIEHQQGQRNAGKQGLEAL